MSKEKKDLPRPNRVTISISDESFAILERYGRLMGISRGRLIDSWILDSLDTHKALLDQIEGVLDANK